MLFKTQSPLPSKITTINLFEKTCNKGEFYGGCYKKAGLMIKKRLRAKHTKPLLMAKKLV
ncbi:hypothetical protein AOD77_0207305 [Helicobacter pylori]|nr:hypothetical protein AOD77_0207305 [Helicobacter pylori]